MTMVSKVDGLLEIMRNRRSIRKFKPDPIPDDAVDKIIEAARWACSGANSQPWEFIVIKDPQTREKITDVFLQTTRKTREIDKNFPFGTDEGVVRHYQAPVLIAVCCDTRLKEAYPLTGWRDETLSVSMGAAIQHMHLAAAALGLGTAWGSVSEPSEKGLKDILGVPSFLKVKEIISLGYPDEQPTARYRRSVEEITHRERLDPTKLRSDEEIKSRIATRKRSDIYTGQASP